MEPTPPRRPGELVFTLFLAAASLTLFISAYGIAGFEALSSPGAVPMATTAAMVVTTLLILRGVWQRGRPQGQTIRHDILPVRIVVTIAMIAAYAILLRPLGFLPTSILFLFVMVRFLSRRSLAFCAAVSLGTVLVIWLIFRIVFAVLMPQGIVPEGRLISTVTSLF